MLPPCLGPGLIAAMESSNTDICHSQSSGPLRGAQATEVHRTDIENVYLTINLPKGYCAQKQIFVYKMHR